MLHHFATLSMTELHPNSCATKTKANLHLVPSSGHDSAWRCTFFSLVKREHRPRRDAAELVGRQIYAAEYPDSKIKISIHTQHSYGQRLVLLKGSCYTKQRIKCPATILKPGAR